MEVNQRSKVNPRKVKKTLADISKQVDRINTDFDIFHSLISDKLHTVMRDLSPLIEEKEES